MSPPDFVFTAQALSFFARRKKRANTERLEKVTFCPRHTKVDFSEKAREAVIEGKKEFTFQKKNILTRIEVHFRCFNFVSRLYVER